MLRARRRAEWKRTAEILATLYNANRGERQAYLSPEKFNPYP